MERAELRPQREFGTGLLVLGWLLVALTVVFPPIAVGGIGMGVLASSRGRKALGASLITASLLALVAFMYLASQTLVPRD